MYTHGIYYFANHCVISQNVVTASKAASNNNGMLDAICMRRNKLSRPMPKREPRQSVGIIACRLTKDILLYTRSTEAIAGGR